MFEQMCESLRANPHKLAYVYHEDDKLSICKTYKDVNQEFQQIAHLFSQLPTGIVIAVLVGKKCCLLPLVFSLLQYKIAFILLDEVDNIEEYRQNISIFAIITCKSHGNNFYSSVCEQVDKTFVQHTNGGCSYTMKTFKHITIEEQAKMLSYKGICYIITTSGTLGRKKLVKVTEDCIYSNIKSFVKLFGITCDDVIYFGTSLTFDPCYIELFLALTTGSSLITTSGKIRKDPSMLINMLFKDENFDCTKVTFMQMCPSVFTQFSANEINYLWFESSLKTLCLGGEQFPAHILPKETPKTCKIYNLYGITEVSCWASVERVVNESEIGLGTPIDETLFKIDTNNDFVEISTIIKADLKCEGILHIGSKTRICYIDNECSNEHLNKNADKIVYRNTGDVVKAENGKLFYVGRENDVIKRFGQRISLLKVQKLIYLETNLANQCIFYKEKIFCFLKPPQQEDIQGNMLKEWKNKTIDKIRVHLLQSMSPEYFPDYLFIINEFPVFQHNGKLDRISLHKLADYELGKLVENTPKSRKDVFIMLWCKHIGVLENQINKTTFYNVNFWDSGGRSISAMQFANEYQYLTKYGLNRNLLDLQFEEALNFFDCDMKINISCESTRETNFKVLWKTDMKACVDSPPIICDINGRVIVAVGNFAHRFSVFDAISGGEIASIDLPNVIEAAPLYCDNIFYVPCFDGQLHCLQLSISEFSGSFNWINTFKTCDRLKSKPVIFCDNILFGGYDGYVYSVTKLGLLSSKIKIGEPIASELKYFKEKIYLTTLRGSYLAIEKGLIVWRYKAHNPIFSPPEISIDNDCVLFLDIQGTIYCVSLSCDAILWVFSANPCKTFGSMTVFENQIFVGTEQGAVNMYVFSKTNCQFLSQFKEDSNLASITTKPLLFNLNDKNYLLVVNSGGCIQLFSLNLNSDNCFADLVDVYFLPNECFSMPQLLLNSCNKVVVYLGCRDDNLYCLEINI